MNRKRKSRRKNLGFKNLGFGRSNRGVLLFAMFMVLLRLVLDFVYEAFVVPVFGYAGFTFDTNPIRFGLSWLFYGAALSVLKCYVRKPSQFFQLFMAVFLIAPLTSLYGLSSQPSSVVLIVLLGYFAVHFCSQGVPFKIKDVKDGLFYAFLVSIVGVAAVLIWAGIHGVFSNMNFDFSQVYEFRRDESRVKLYSGIFAYLSSWTFKVFNIFLIVMAVKYRSRVLVLGGLVLQILFYGISTHKSLLAYPIMVIGLTFIFKKRQSLNMGVVPLAAVLCLLVAFAMSVNEAEDVMAGSVIIRRVFFIPAQLLFAYYEFFELNPKVYWSNSLLSFFIDYPYSSRTTILIGEFLGRDEMSANNNFLATGYMHGGVYGVLFYSVLIGLIFRLIDSLAVYGVDLWQAIALTIVPVSTLILSSDLPTALWTHGLIVSVFLLYLLREHKMNLWTGKRGRFLRGLVGSKRR